MTTSSMQPHELDAWLGDTALTAEQRSRFTDEITSIFARYPDADDESDRDTAMSAALQWILGETTVEAAGQVLLAARIAAATALVTAQQVARMAVLDGGAEATVARTAGLDRMTVRKVLGKR